LRDVFVLINEAICHFPCHIIRSIPYITFNLDECTPKLINDKIQEVIYYLTSKIEVLSLIFRTYLIDMNILSESYPDLFENTSYLAQETPLVGFLLFLIIVSIVVRSNVQVLVKVVLRLFILIMPNFSHL
jgi:hypothetical protein